MTSTSSDRLRPGYEQHYEICVGGRLGDLIRFAFPALRMRARGDDTILSGMFADQAALYGTLTQMEGLGLELIEIRRLPSARSHDS
jgi:hypothetical protein